MAVFVLAVERGSFTAAALALGITGTMVGLHIQSLEKRLGVRLLHRTTRRQSLSEFGQTYYDKCKQILRDVGEAESLAENQRPKPRGLLRIISPVSFGVHAISPLLNEYLSENDEVTIDLVLSDKALDMVDERAEIMIKIGALQHVYSMIARPLKPYRSIICASPGYLEACGTPTAPQDLSKHRCLGFAHPVATDEWVLQGRDGPVTVAVNLALSVNNGEALRMAALNGLGIIMQPEILLAEDIETTRLVPLLQNYAPLPKAVHLLTLPDRQQTPKVRSFIDFLLSRFTS